MIEINLIARKKKKKSHNALGPLAKLPWKSIIVALIILYAPQFWLYPFFTGQVKEIQRIGDSDRKQLRRLTKKINQNKKVVKMLADFKKQIEILKTRRTQVEKILNQRTNPKLLLERLARNLPEDVWFEKLVIDANRRITIDGKSASYRSIGEYLTSVNNSPFFGGKMSVVNPSTKEEMIGGQKIRLEKFQLSAMIEVFDPWLKQ